MATIVRAMLTGLRDRARAIKSMQTDMIGISMTNTVDEAITSRRSVRAFLPRPVSKELVEHILQVASRAPSGTNTQPWNVRVLAGEVKEKLCKAAVYAHAHEEFHGWNHAGHQQAHTRARSRKLSFPSWCR